MTGDVGDYIMSAKMMACDSKPSLDRDSYPLHYFAMMLVMHDSVFSKIEKVNQVLPCIVC